MALVLAHITGTVWSIEVAIGDAVADGDAVVVIESMKMELPVESEFAGTVAELLCAVGDTVTEGQPIARIE